MRTGIACLPLEVLVTGEGHDAARNAQRVVAAIDAVRRADPDLRIVVLPAFALTGGSGSAGREPADSVLRLLSACARQHGLCVAGADRFGDALLGFVIAADGRLAIVQPPVGEAAGPARVETFDSGAGILACLVGDDVLQPEYARLAMFRGAEILLNPCAERTDHRSESRALGRGARSWENHAAVATASLSGIVDAHGLRSPAFTGAGVAAVWGFGGELLASGRNEPVSATVDLVSLRQRRRDPWVNFPAQLRTALYAGVYERAARGEYRRDVPQEGPVYEVLLAQTHELFVTSPATRDQDIHANLQGMLGLAKAWAMRPAIRLVVFPEFCLQGSMPGQTLEFWEQVGIRVGGPETQALAAFARETSTYTCAAILEYDPDWPRRYFNTSLIFSPQGELILRYRKIQCADVNGLLNVTTPGNVYTEYVERYGVEGLIPVVDTEIGRLGTAICYDTNWPELWRAMGLKGAEVVCNPTSEINSDRLNAWYAARRAHAAENLFYVATANAGSEQFFRGAPVTSMNRGRSCLVDFHGRLAAQADAGGIVPMVGRIDLGALRRARASTRDNVLAQFRPETVVDAYRDYPGFPLDCFAARPMERAEEGLAITLQQIERLTAGGVLRRAGAA